jgi:hypothetical protein
MRGQVRAVAAALLCLHVAPRASAQTVTSLVVGENVGVVTSDARGPSAEAVTSHLTFPGTYTVIPTGPGFGRASIRPDGVGAVIADATYADGGITNYVESRVTWTDSATNGGSEPAGYAFDFSITPASLRIWDYTGAAAMEAHAPDISFRAVIRANGVSVFEAGAVLRGGIESHTLTESGSSLGPSFVGTGAGNVFGYDFMPHSGSVDLGTVGPGESVTVEYEMVARVAARGTELGGRARLGDPFDLAASPGFSGTIVPAPPTPAVASSWARVKALYR